MDEKILLFNSRQLCYYSNSHFVEKMAEALRKCGYDVELCDLFENSDEGYMEAQLEEYIGKSYRAVIDFNSRLPRMEVENGVPYLDTIKAPFFNYIVDHPLYHHPGLVRPGLAYHVICLDENHKNYVEQYYPHIKSCHVLPLGSEIAEGAGGRQGEQKSLNQQVVPREAPPRVLFMGTYVPAEELWEQIMELPHKFQEEIREIVAQMKKYPHRTQEEILWDMLREKNAQKKEPVSEDKIRAAFADRMNLEFMADKYVRSFDREWTIQQLLEHGIGVDLRGNGWGDYVESLPEPLQNLVRVFPAVDFAESLHYIADADFLFHLQPLFQAGIHDRIISAMLNHTLCLCDSSDYLRSQIEDRKEIWYYEKTEAGVDRLAEEIRELWKNPQQIRQMTDCAFEKAQKCYTWDRWAQSFGEILEELE